MLAVMAEAETIVVDLIAVLVAVTEGDPRVLTVADGRALPAGPLTLGHRSLQAGLRGWVEEQAHHPLGYVEQLYTFADRDRPGHAPGQRVISISYLGLTREREVVAESHPGWQSWYRMFPWEDRRAGAPEILADIAGSFRDWAAGREARWQRAAIAFGFDRQSWNEELVLQRYELLYEAGLVAEAPQRRDCAVVPGRNMMADHRRILATGIARLRAKIKYRPVVFELMPGCFTLLQLQRCVEAIAGLRLHKQNFRRLIEQQELVEETGASADTGGRPAKLFRFRREVLAERAAAGTKLPLSRG
jgi:hypothetical protein